MHIQKELHSHYAIKAYDSSQIQIAELIYTKSLIISANQLISDWPVTALNEVTLATLEPFFKIQPDVIIIGHHGNQHSLTTDLQITLSQKRIGIECMALGAACRTYNLLLSEGRTVAAGLILQG